MNKKVIVIGIIIFFMSVVLIGCIEQETTSTTNSNSFVGTWKTDATSSLGEIVTFFSDGTVSLYNYIGGYFEIMDEKLVVTLGNNELRYSFEYYFSNNGKKLTMIPVGSEDEIIYIKQPSNVYIEGTLITVSQLRDNPDLYSNKNVILRGCDTEVLNDNKQVLISDCETGERFLFLLPDGIEVKNGYSYDWYGKIIVDEAGIGFEVTKVEQV